MHHDVTHAIHVLTSIIVEALGKRRRPDLAQASLDAMDAFRRLYEAQRSAWRAELASDRARLTKLEAKVKRLDFLADDYMERLALLEDDDGNDVDHLASNEDGEPTRSMPPHVPDWEADEPFAQEPLT